MATRFYFTSTTASPASPTFGAPWSVTTSSQRHLLSRTKTNTPLTNISQSETSTNGFTNVLVSQFVSDPLTVDQTISGTVSAVVRGLETAGALASLQMAVLVYSSTNVLRGTLYAGHGIENNQTSGALGQELSTTAKTRIFPSQNLTPVNALVGDRIAVSIGTRNRNVTATSMTSTFTFGDPTATADYALTPELTADGTPWVEFSQDLFPAAPTPVETTAQASWGTRAAITLTSATDWAVKTPVFLPYEASWAAYTSVQTSSSTAWSSSASVTSTAATSFSVNSALVSETATSFSVLSALSAGAGASWSVLGSVLSDTGTLYSVRTTVSAGGATVWAVLTPVLPYLSTTSWDVDEATVGGYLDFALPVYTSKHTLSGIIVNMEVSGLSTSLTLKEPS